MSVARIYLLFGAILIVAQLFVNPLRDLRFGEPTNDQNQVNGCTGDIHALRHESSGGITTLPNRRHHALVIPFRNRTTHLESFIQQMGPYLKRNFPDDDFSLFVMEQADDQSFNRGFLINCGITEIYKRYPATSCVTSHDVDLIPKFNGVPYTSCEQPIQLGSELEHFNWSYPYPNNCGGIINMHMIHWRTINGMSNDYQGWGGEDDDLYCRLHRNDLLRNPMRSVPENAEIVRPPQGKGAFVNLELNVTTKGNQTVIKQPSAEETWERKSAHEHYANNVCLLQRMQEGSDRWKYDGLSDLKYEVLGDVIVQNVNGSEDFSQIRHFQVVGRENNLTAELGNCVPR